MNAPRRLATLWHRINGPGLALAIGVLAAHALAAWFEEFGG